jgi:lactoylglutathione lyase
MTLDELNSAPGVTARPDAATARFVFNHTMLRVKDIEQSLDFYTRVLGFSVVEARHFPEAKFSLYFLALIDKSTIPQDDAARHEWMKSIPGILELTHNHGTESDPAFAGYHDGNTEPRGFGHICVSVPDVKEACARFEQLGVNFQKRLADGRMKSLAFIKDPDGYWVEIIQPTPVE